MAVDWLWGAEEGSGEWGVGKGERGGRNRAKTKPNETKRKLAPLAADKETEQQEEETETEAQTASFPLAPSPTARPATRRVKGQNKERKKCQQKRKSDKLHEH